MTALAEVRMMRRILAVSALCLLPAALGFAQQGEAAKQAAAYKDGRLLVEKHAEYLRRRRTLEEKVAQLHQERHTEILKRGVSDEALDRFFQGRRIGDVSVFALLQEELVEFVRRETVCKAIRSRGVVRARVIAELFYG